MGKNKYAKPTELSIKNFKENYPPFEKGEKIPAIRVAPYKLVEIPREIYDEAIELYFSPDKTKHGKLLKIFKPVAKKYGLNKKHCQRLFYLLNMPTKPQIMSDHLVEIVDLVLRGLSQGQAGEKIGWLTNSDGSWYTPTKYFEEKRKEYAKKVHSIKSKPYV